MALEYRRKLDGRQDLKETKILQVRNSEEKKNGKQTLNTPSRVLILNLHFHTKLY